MTRTDYSKSSVASLSHRVSLCTANDVVLENGAYRITKEKVLSMWASIEPKLGSMFSREGFTVMESTSRQTHVICMRYRRDFDITSSAWIYEERLQSAPRWFKILAVSDENDKWYFKCRLVEQSDMVREPDEPVASCEPIVGGAVALPPGVKL